MPESSTILPLSVEGFNIEEYDPSGGIEGTEGMDVNHAARLKMQFLTAQHASMITQTQFADAKAAALMTVMGLVALNGPVKMADAGADDLFAVGIFAILILTIVIAMTALIPRYPDKDLSEKIKRGERFSWPALVAQGYEPLAHAQFVHGAEASQLLLSVGQTNGNMARLLKRKFRNLRIAFILGALDLVLIVAYVLNQRYGLTG